MTHRANADFEAPPAPNAPHENMTSMPPDNNEHPPHPDDSSPLSSTRKGKKQTAHHHSAHHRIHSSHKKHRASTDIESSTNESNVAFINDAPTNSITKTKAHHHHKHHHAHTSHKKKHGTPDDSNIASPEVPQATSPVEPNVVSEDQVPAAAPQYDVESPPPIGTPCMAANNDSPKAIATTKASTQVQEKSHDEAPARSIESPRKIQDEPIAMDTKKVHPAPNNTSAIESQPDSQSPPGNESNCSANISIFLGVVSLFCFGLIFGVLAIGCAQSAFGQLEREPHRFNDDATRCKATTGTILGTAGVLIWLIIVFVVVSA